MNSAENFRIVDIEINALSPLILISRLIKYENKDYINLKINKKKIKH